MTRRRVVLTITLTGEACGDRRDEAISIWRLSWCVGEALAVLLRFLPGSGLTMHHETQHLQQQDEGALWETVGREG